MSIIFQATLVLIVCTIIACCVEWVEMDKKADKLHHSHNQPRNEGKFAESQEVNTYGDLRLSLGVK